MEKKNSSFRTRSTWPVNKKKTTTELDIKHLLIYVIFIMGRIYRQLMKGGSSHSLMATLIDLK